MGHGRRIYISIAESNLGGIGWVLPLDKVVRHLCGADTPVRCL
jgi:hypothetical protein